MTSEQAIAKFDTLEKICAQLLICDYESIGGPLRLNGAFIALQRMPDRIAALEAENRRLRTGGSSAMVALMDTTLALTEKALEEKRI